MQQKPQYTVHFSETGSWISPKIMAMIPITSAPSLNQLCLPWIPPVSPIQAPLLNMKSGLGRSPPSPALSNIRTLSRPRGCGRSWDVNRVIRTDTLTMCPGISKVWLASSFERRFTVCADLLSLCIFEISSDRKLTTSRPLQFCRCAAGSARQGSNRSKALRWRS